MAEGVSGLGGTMATVEHEPIMGVWGQSPQRGPGAACNTAYSVDITCLVNNWIFTCLISSLDYL